MEYSSVMSRKARDFRVVCVGTHELLQYHFRTVAAFEYDKDDRELSSASGLPIRGMERPERGHETLEAYSVRNHGAFSEPRPHRFGM